jgi:hypothetical protein
MFCFLLNLILSINLNLILSINWSKKCSSECVFPCGSLISASEALRQGRISKKEFETAKTAITAQTNGAIRRGFKRAGLDEKLGTTKS